MKKKLKLKRDKILFCYEHTTTFRSFLSMLISSKLLRWSKNAKSSALPTERTTRLDFIFKGISRDLYLRVYAGDFDIFYEVLYHECYNVKTFLNFDVRTIVDLGSNIGLAAVYFSAYFPDSFIICVEPDITNFNLLKKNLASEIKSKKVACLNAAIGSKDGLGNLKPGRFRHNTQVDTAESGKNPVKVISINRLMEDYNLENIDLLKIDIEGGERELFSGNLEWLTATKSVLIEFHGDELFEKCVHVLKSAGFVVNKLNETIFLAVKLSLQ